MKLSSAAKATLRSALQRFDDGDGRGASELVGELADADAPTLVVASRVLALLRDFPGAVDLLTLASERSKSDYPPRARYALRLRLRFYEEAHRDLVSLLERSPENPKLREAAALFYQSMDEPNLALPHLRRVIRHQPDAAHWQRLATVLSAQAGDAKSTTQFASRALELGGDWTEVADSLMEVGALEQLRVLLEQHSDSEARSRLAELYLFAGELDRARATAADNGLGLRVRAAADVLEGQLERAEASLNQFQDRRAADHVWRAELLFRRGDLEGAARELEVARAEVPDYLAAKLVWARLSLETSGRDRESADLSFEGLLAGQIQALGISVEVRDGYVERGELQRVVSEALAVLGGNRTPLPTRVVDDGLKRVHVPASSRHVTRRAQHTARWRGIAASTEAVDRVLAELGGDPVAACYRGELDLWRGDGEVALACFERICAHDSRIFWSWVGRGAAHLLLGQPERALEVLDEGKRQSGREGASLPVYEAEARWRTGAHAEALDAIRRVTDTQPRRAAAWVLQCLIANDAAQPALRDDTFDVLCTRVPALMADAAKLATGSAVISDGAAVEVCRSALELLRGNRASSLPLYFSPSDECVRTVLMDVPITTRRWEADERAALGQVVA